MTRTLALLISSLTALCSMGYELAFASYISRIIGNEVLGQTLTIGIFLLFMGAGSAWAERRIKAPNTWLLRIELILTFNGFLAPTILHVSVASLMLLGLIPNHPSAHQDQTLLLSVLNIPVAFTGFLTGSELPLIFKSLENKQGKFNHNVLIFLNYMGGLGAGVLFFQLLTKGASAGQSFQIFAWVNLIACFILFFKHPRKTYAPVLVSLILLAPFSDRIYKRSEDFATKIDYYGHRLTSISSESISASLNTIEKYGSVNRIYSPYQTIDMVRNLPFQYKGISDESSFDLYLNRSFQLNTETYLLYHQTFSHAFLNLIGKSPKRPVILGGGDGVLAGELLKYPDIEKVKLIELDPAMVELSSKHPEIVSANKGSLESSRLEIIHDDAFNFLSSRAPNSIETIFIDFPFPNTSELKKLYSIEFYGLLSRAMNEDGFAIMDAPIHSNLETGEFSQGTKTLITTLRAAGFNTIFAFGPHTPFLVLSKSAKKMSFDFEKAKASSLMHTSVYMNLLPIDISVFLESPLDHDYVNSIFKPGVFKK